MTYVPTATLGAAPNRRRVMRGPAFQTVQAARQRMARGRMQVVQRRHYAIVRPMPVVPSNYVIGDCSELGFSLKPPRWARKLTIKKVIKPLAIAAAVGASLFIPGVAPAALAIGKGALSAGKFVGTGILRGGRAVGKGVMNLLPHKAAPSAADIAASLEQSGGAAPATSAPSLWQQIQDAARSGAAPATPTLPDLNLPSPTQAASGGYSGGGGSSAPTGVPNSADTPGGGSAADAGADTGGEPVPTRAGFNPMVVGGIALLGLALASQSGSRKR